MEQQFNRAEFNADISSKLDDVRTNYLNSSDPDSKSFVYAIADIFESTDEDVFTYTDGANDKGIDFVIQDGNTFKFYQCKSVESLSDSEGKVFDAGPVNELQEAIEFLCDQNPISASREVTSFKNQYQLNSKDNTLYAVLAIEGALSESAQERFEQIKEKCKRSGISVGLIDEKALYDNWHSLDNLKKPADVHIDLELVNGDAVLKQKGWLYGVFRLEPFLKAMKEYGNGLFDLNVRSNLRRSSVNDEIRKTISTAKGQKNFIHLNNGLVILCQTYKHRDGEARVRLNGAQVVNGCQTLSTIWNYYLSANDHEKEQIKDNLKLFAKIINNEVVQNDGLLDDVIVASNNQNAMNARNLKSNTAEQRRLQQSFWSNSLRSDFRYYYIRKDGEFDSFLESGKRNPKKSEFAIPNSTKRGANKYRHINNESLAQIWWSWIGNSSKANVGGQKYFEGSLYGNIFEKHPSEELLNAMSDEEYTFSSRLLEAGSPSCYQFLLAAAISSFISMQAKPKCGIRQFKQERIKALQDNGKLKPNANSQEVALALSKDQTFLHSSWKSQMTLALTEIACFILTKRYGALTPDTCRRIMNLPDISQWITNGMNASSVDIEAGEGNGLLSILWTFIDNALKGFFAANMSAILVENRPKLFLSRSDNIIAIKRCCIEADENYIDIALPGKRPGISFFDAFPEL